MEVAGATASNGPDPALGQAGGSALARPIEWDDQKVSRLWNYYAEHCPVPYFSDLHGGELLKRTGLPLNASLDVLDFGCGPGFIWQHLQRLGARWNYTGIDFSPDSVEKLRAKATGHPNFKGVQPVTGLPTPLPEAIFDVVLLIEVVEHLNDAHLDGTLKEASRVLKPGGAFVVSTPNEEDLAQAHKFCPECSTVFHEWQHVRRWSQATLTEQVSRYGFKPQAVGAFNFSATGLLRRAYFFAKRLRDRSYRQPHMLAVFRKI